MLLLVTFWLLILENRLFSFISLSFIKRKTICFKFSISWACLFFSLFNSKISFSNLLFLFSFKLFISSWRNITLSINSWIIESLFISCLYNVISNFSSSPVKLNKFISNFISFSEKYFILIFSLSNNFKIWLNASFILSYDLNCLFFKIKFSKFNTLLYSLILKSFFSFEIIYILFWCNPILKLNKANLFW